MTRISAITMLFMRQGRIVFSESKLFPLSTSASRRRVARFHRAILSKAADSQGSSASGSNDDRLAGSDIIGENWPRPRTAARTKSLLDMAE
ncbi:MAG: hypothetical protein MZU97_19105 [Bacillus subtilis]|nr:hypothetical protein [Bacillus subtilis]